MRLKMILTVLVFGAVIPASCQVVSQATDTSGTPLTIGVGYSNYYSNWNGRLSGPVIWADWSFYGKRSYLHGFGVELEARDLNYGRTGSVPNLRMDTATGGVIYTCRRFRKINPYAKYSNDLFVGWRTQVSSVSAGMGERRLRVSILAATPSGYAESAGLHNRHRI